MYNQLTNSLMKMLRLKGVNIDMLINKFKKDAGWEKKKKLPEEVVQRVCRAGLNTEKIDVPYLWFIKVLQKESGLYFVNKNIQEAKESRGTNPTLLKQLFGGK